MRSYSSDNFACPYCGSDNLLTVDFPSSSAQNFVQDCEVCCKPILIQLVSRNGEILELRIQRENE